eukprot:Seg1826.7 transcript_id=Seg1826.7/GoldUCD/mRNA.D3Y31 product=Ferritin protein_id=Seg1826.7/GoldUCD/D3Y31
MSNESKNKIRKLSYNDAETDKTVQAKRTGKYCPNNRYHSNAGTGRTQTLCKLEDLVNVQINREFKAFYAYMRVGNFFAHESYNLPYFSKYFLASAQDELKHAQKLMEYQILRGAHVKLLDIEAPDNRIFHCALEAMQYIYDLEFNITQNIEDLWKESDGLQDMHLQDFIETNYIPEQYESMKKIQNYIGTLKRMADCGPFSETSGGCCGKLAEFQFDKIVMKDATA